MRKEASNQSAKAFNSYLFLCKLTKSNQRVFFVVLLILFVSINSFSQAISRPKQSVEKYAPSVIKLDDYVKSLAVSSDNQTDKDVQNNLLSLIKDLKPTIYLKNGLVKTYGENPSVLRSDVASLKLASNNKSSMKDVEIIIINVDSPKDVQTPIDLSFVTNLKKVRYVYLLLSFDESASTLSNWIRNVNQEMVVLYTIDNRS
jgi:hypothetical protein